MFRDIAPGGEDQSGLRVRHRIPVQRAIRAIEAAEAVLEADGIPAGREFFHFGKRGSSVVWMDEFGKGLAEQLRLGVTEHPSERGIHFMEIPLGARDTKKVQRQVEETVPFFLQVDAFGEGLMCGVVADVAGFLVGPGRIGGVSSGRNGSVGHGQARLPQYME